MLCIGIKSIIRSGNLNVFPYLKLLVTFLFLLQKGENLGANPDKAAELLVQSIAVPGTKEHYLTWKFLILVSGISSLSFISQEDPC